MAAAAEAMRISASSAELVLCLKPPPPPRLLPLKSMALLNIRSGLRLPDLGEEFVGGDGV